MGRRTTHGFYANNCPCGGASGSTGFAQSSSSFCTWLILVLTGYRRIAPAYGTSHLNAVRMSRIAGFSHDPYAPDGRITRHAIMDVG